LHGGATSTLIDYFTTYAIMSLDDGRHPGVSVELNVSFLSAAPKGTRIFIESEVQKSGKSLAFSTCTIKKKTESGRLVAMGRHTKFLANL